jgi:hypothetical protein
VLSAAIVAKSTTFLVRAFRSDVPLFSAIVAKSGTPRGRLSLFGGTLSAAIVAKSVPLARGWDARFFSAIVAKSLALAHLDT